MSTKTISALGLEQVANPWAPARVRRYNRQATSLALVVTDALALFVSWAVAVLTRHSLGGQFELSFYLGLSPILLLFLTIFGMQGLYPGIGLDAANEFKRVAQSTTISFLFLGTSTFFFRDAGDYSRLAVLLAWAVSIPLVISSRALSRRLFQKTKWWGEPVVVIGLGEEALQVAEKLKREERTGLRVEGVILTENLREAWRASSVPLAGTLADLEAFTRTRQIQYGVIVSTANAEGRMIELIREVSQIVKRVLVVPVELRGFSSLGAQPRDIRGQLGIEITHKLLSMPAQISKRIFDVVVSAALMVVLSPVLAVLGVLIVWTSKGRVIYGQPRLGMNGELFKAWKFRTMVTGADDVLAGHLYRDPGLAAEWAENHKLRRDPRVTLIGRLLRKTSLDELPQLWNIIRGEMSLVGPRPIVGDEVEKYGNAYDLYKRVRPGVTGLWQVSGRNNTTYPERVAYDEYYVRNWSLWLDIHILYRTVRVVLLQEGAY